MITRRLVTRTVPTWDKIPSPLSPGGMGINLPWLNNHSGSQVVNFLGANYNASQIEADLAVLQTIGVTKIRVFATIEAVMDYSGGSFIINTAAANNLDDLLNRAYSHGMSSILVMGDGNSSGAPSNLDGKFRWDLIQIQSGLTAYATAAVTYINRFNYHSNILMWEIANEPYYNQTASPRAIALGITKDQVHTYLKSSYDAVKNTALMLPITEPVGFSDYEEEEQAQYHVFSDIANRRVYVDDCTDIYSMHFFRSSSSQIADFRDPNPYGQIRMKRRWCTELGSLNYIDLTGASHGGLPGNNELVDEQANSKAVRDISRKLFNAGFELVMLWDSASNSGMFTHNADGSHTIKSLPRWVQSQLKTSSRKPALNRRST